MGRSDWDITGVGGCSVLEETGSKRCQITGEKLMLWNGNSSLTDSEVVFDFKVYGSNTNTRTGAVLRCQGTLNDCYKLLTYGPRTYYIVRVVDGVSTTLTVIASSQPYNIYVKTRFRIDGYQLSVEEYISGEWNLIAVVEDTAQAFASGYAGLFGQSITTGYYSLFDNVDIRQKI